MDIILSNRIGPTDFVIFGRRDCNWDCCSSSGKPYAFEYIVCDLSYPALAGYGCGEG